MRCRLSAALFYRKKKSNEAWLKYDRENKRFTIEKGVYDKKLENGTKQGKKAVFSCICCNDGIANGEYIDKEAQEGRMGVTLLGIVAEGERGRIYLSVDEDYERKITKEIEDYYSSNDIDSIVSHAECRGTFASNAQGRRYSFKVFKDYFTHRQLTTLTTFSALVAEAQQKAHQDALTAGMTDDGVSLADGGSGAKAYGEAVGVYLAFVVDKLADYHSSICSWHSSGQKMRNTFGRQAIPMVWDFAEGNPFSDSSGCFDNMLEWVYKCVDKFPSSKEGCVNQFNATEDSGLRNIMVSTDPPYYDNIGYADLSDYFYVWIRQALKKTYPNILRTMLVPKEEELIATPYRHDGSKQKAKEFFENGMLEACRQIYKYAIDNVPVTIYYAYKQSDTDNKNTTASSGWETMLSAIIKAGFAITGTWPIRTEMANRTISMGSNALASSIVLVCRKRDENAPVQTRRNFVNELRRSLRPALQELKNSNIAPVDLAQSAIGPGIGVFSKYSKVLEADGMPMTVRSALQIINQEIDMYFNEQDSSLDSESRFCVDLYSQYAFNDMPFGDANTLATAKNTSVASMAAHGILYAQKGKVHLTERTELPEKINEDEKCIWLLCQQLTQKMEKEGIEGCADAIKNMFGSNAEYAKDLAYRLYTIAERKKWTQEAYAYNALVVAWQEIQDRAAELKTYQPQQGTLFD